VYLPCFESGLDYKLALLDCLGYIQNCLICIAYDGMILQGILIFSVKMGQLVIKYYRMYFVIITVPEML